MNRRQSRQIQTVKLGLKVLTRLPTNEPELRAILAGRTRIERHLDTAEREASLQLAARTRLNRTGMSTSALRSDYRTLTLIPVVRKAKLLFRDNATVMAALRVPLARETLEAHAVAGLAVAKALAPHEKFCRSEEFPRHFLRDLRAGAKTLRAAATLGDKAREEQSRATRALQPAIAAARAEMRAIDADIEAYRLRAMRTRPSSAPASQAKILDILREWSDQTRIGKPVGRPRKRKRKSGGSAADPATT
jgi:hypothetical protein